MHLFVLFAAFECGDGVLVGVGGDGDTLGDFRRRRRSLEDAVVLLSVRRLLTRPSRRRGRRRLDEDDGKCNSYVNGASTEAVFYTLELNDLLLSYTV